MWLIGRADEEHPRRGVRHLLRQPGDLPVPERRGGDRPEHNIGFRCAVGVCDLVLAQRRGTRRPTVEEEHRQCRRRWGHDTRRDRYRWNRTGWSQYAVPIPCYICEAENTFDAEFCRHCLAPMALAHQASSQKVRRG